MKLMRLYCILFFLPYLCLSQEGFTIIRQKKTTIPFQLINNLIFIPVKVNGVELTFLLDSGVTDTLLFSLDNKEVNFNDVEKTTFSGLGDENEIEGLKSINNTVLVGNNYIDHTHQIYIIINEEFNFSSHVGIPVNGIIGYYFFKNHPVKIDYIKKNITIFPNQQKLLKATKNYTVFPISIENKKPYMMADIEQSKEKIPSKLLIDTGNSDAVWIFPNLMPNFLYDKPSIDDYLGRGFNGDIYGKRSRIHYFYLGDFKLGKPFASIPDDNSIKHLNMVKDRKGSIGEEILRRFQVILDYPNQNIYFKKNSYFGEPFHFNMSGLDVKNDGLHWAEDLVKVENPKKPVPSNEITAYSTENHFKYKFVLKPDYSVAGCRKNAPCDKAGIKKDDKILKIDGKNASDLTLEKINQILKSEEGKNISLVLERNGTILKIEFKLEDPIPYKD